MAGPSSIGIRGRRAAGITAAPAGLITRTMGDGAIVITYRDVSLYVPERARGTVARIVSEHVELALQTLAGYIADEAPVGVTGNLAQSFASGGVSGGLEISSGTFEETTGRVFSSLPYAVVMDQGRRPGAPMPPIDAIMLWVERVLGIRESDDFELEETAWAIARSIARQGIEARHFVERGTARAFPTLEEIFRMIGDAVAIGLVE